MEEIATMRHRLWARQVIHRHCIIPRFGRYLAITDLLASTNQQPTDTATPAELSSKYKITAQLLEVQLATLQVTATRAGLSTSPELCLHPCHRRPTRTFIVISPTSKDPPRHWCTPSPRAAIPLPIRHKCNINLHILNWTRLIICHNQGHPILREALVHQSRTSNNNSDFKMP